MLDGSRALDRSETSFTAIVAALRHLLQHLAEHAPDSNTGLQMLCAVGSRGRGIAREAQRLRNLWAQRLQPLGRPPAEVGSSVSGAELASFGG